MLIQKTLSFNDAEIKVDGASGQFSGYASKWGGVDTYGDTILKGAFAETLRINGQPKLYLEHSWKMGGALLPIGKSVCEEDDIGLAIRGELTPGLSYASDVYAAMKHGTIDGLSIGGLTKKTDCEETSNGRLIKKWHNLFDVSIVTHPADGKARIESVKSEDLASAINEIETIREFERFLRDAGGFSKGVAVALTARAKQIVMAEGDPGDEDAITKELQARLDRLAARFAS